MPKRGGHNYYAQYYNSEGEINQKRNKGKRAKPTSAETLAFIERSMNHFKSKYGIIARSITMSQEMKDMIDSRVKGKGFLKRKNIIVASTRLGLRTIHLSELKEGINETH